MKKSPLKRTLPFGVAIFLFSSGARAQTEPVPYTTGFPLLFNFSSPGARGAALGASFIGSADDPVAAATNPAGLTLLAEPQISAQIRLSGMKFEQPGLLGATTRLSQQRTISPSFLGGAVPFGKGAVSAYYLEEARFDARFAEPPQGRADLGPFRVPELATQFPGSQTFRYTERQEVKLRQFGAAGAVKVTPTVSVGGSFRYAFANVDAEIVEDFDQPAVDARFGNYFTRTTSVNDADHDVTFSAGVLFSPNTKFSAGAAYRQGAEHAMTGTITDLSLGRTDVTTLPVRFSVPDSYGFGVALRPLESLALVLDVVRVEYSDLRQDRSGSPIQDGNELHGGAEYVLRLGPDALPLTLRGGFYTDPDHDEFATIDSGQVHGTFGAGVFLSGRYQIDFSVNLSKSVKEGIVSFGARF